MLKIKMLGSELSYCLLSNHPSRPALNQAESRLMPKATSFQKSFLQELIISYGVLDKKGYGSSGNNRDNSLGKELMIFLFSFLRIFDRKFPFLFRIPSL